MWLTTPSVCTEQRLKANLRSTDWAAEHISRVLIAWPHILDSVPKMNVRGALHIASHKFSFYPWTRLGGQRRIAQYVLCATPQALHRLHAQALRWGVHCAHTRHSYVCVNTPCVSIPSSLPTSDPVMMAVWKLKRQGAAYESVDHAFSLPFAIWVSKPAGTVPLKYMSPDLPFSALF